jgi:hypothetical protein
LVIPQALLQSIPCQGSGGALYFPEGLNAFAFVANSHYFTGNSHCYIATVFFCRFGALLEFPEKKFKNYFYHLHANGSIPFIN